MTATPPATVWRVKRRWMPRLGQETLWGRVRRRYRRTVHRSTDVAQADPGCLEVFGEGVLAALAIIAFVLFVVFVGLPVLLIVIDVLVLLVLAVLGIVARVIFRRPWLIEARDGSATVLRWRVVGWRASKDQLALVEQHLAAGITPPGAEVIVQPLPDQAG